MTSNPHSRSIRTTSLAAAGAVAALLALGACSSDDKVATTTTVAVTTPAAVTDAPTTAVPATDAPTTTAVTETTVATSTAPSTGGSAAPAGDEQVLTISNFQFSALTVKAGEEFTITNADTAPHTVTDDAGSFGVPVAGGASGVLTIATAGTYAIHCDVHPSMKGTITVD